MDPARDKKQEMPVGEDAAAAARRIVEEVLARRGGPQEGPSGTAGTPGTGRDTVAAEAAAADDVDAADVVTERVVSTPPEPAAGPGSARPEAPAGRPEEVSEAQRIARRIVDEVLADEAEVTVRGVQRDGLRVEGERTAKIEVDPHHPPGETTQRVPGGSGAAAPPGAASRQSGAVGADGLPAGPVEDRTDAEAPAGRAGRARGPSPDPDSADEIVRRIVADVQSEDPPGTAELPVGMTHDSGDPGAAIAEDDGTTRVVPRTGKKREAPSESTSGPLALTDDGEPAPTRPLVGWAPPEPEPTSAPEVPEDPAPRALRWLLASLVGAVALAVLFPLAVAALRALVSLG